MGGGHPYPRASPHQFRTPLSNTAPTQHASQPRRCEYTRVRYVTRIAAEFLRNVSSASSNGARAFLTYSRWVKGEYAAAYPRSHTGLIQSVVTTLRDDALPMERAHESNRMPGLSDEQKDHHRHRLRADKTFTAIGRALGKHADSNFGVVADGDGIVPPPLRHQSSPSPPTSAAA